MKIGFACAALAFAAASASAAGQPPALSCPAVKALAAAAAEAKPFGTVRAANGAGTLKPGATATNCVVLSDYGHAYRCNLPATKASVAATHARLKADLSACLAAGPTVENVEPALLATGRLPNLSWTAPGNRAFVHLYARTDWGGQESYDEEFTAFGFDLVVSRAN